MSVDRQLMAALAGNSGQGIQTDSVLKRELAKIMLADPAGIVSYYILNKKLNGKPLYDPTNKTDIRIIGPWPTPSTSIAPTTRAQPI